jgi:hypothetical protein
VKFSIFAWSSAQPMPGRVGEVDLDLEANSRQLAEREQVHNDIRP